MEGNKSDNSKTLLEVFNVGDRVKQVCYEPNGVKREFTGFIMKIQPHCIAVQWDSVNGNPLSDIRSIYSIFHESEVFNGNENTSPIIKEN